MHIFKINYFLTVHYFNLYHLHKSHIDCFPHRLMVMYMCILN